MIVEPSATEKSSKTLNATHGRLTHARVVTPQQFDDTQSILPPPIAVLLVIVE